MSKDIIVIDGRAYYWKDVLTLRRTQLEARAAGKVDQLALFEMLHDDRRPAEERSASRRYLQPRLFEQGVH